MTVEWKLPNVAKLEPLGKEWILHLLDGRSDLERTRILMTLWRIWHVRNEIIHDKPVPPVESSRRFLCSYVDSLMTIKYHPQADVKGKHPAIVDYQEIKRTRRRQRQDLKKACIWQKPDAGIMKLNVDGSYSAQSGDGGAGVVLRDDTGTVLLSACRYIPRCASPLEAELIACKEGITMARDDHDQPCIVEMDSSEAVRMILSKELDRSSFSHTVQDIKQLLQLDPRYKLIAVDRNQNCASHLLANRGRLNAENVTLIRTGPEDVYALCLQEATALVA